MVRLVGAGQSLECFCAVEVGSSSHVEGVLIDDDKLVCVNNVLKGKLLESDLVVSRIVFKQHFYNKVINHYHEHFH